MLEGKVRCLETFGCVPVCGGGWKPEEYLEKIKKGIE